MRKRNPGEAKSHALRPTINKELLRNFSSAQLAVPEGASLMPGAFTGQGHAGGGQRSPGSESGLSDFRAGGLTRCATGLGGWEARCPESRRDAESNRSASAAPRHPLSFSVSSSLPGGIPLGQRQT